MRTRALQLLAIGCLVALAGCTGGLPGGEDTATLDDVSYPDGVAENGTNVTALSDAHTAALENRSFTLHVDSTVNSSASNESVQLDARVGPNRDEMRVNTTAGDQQMSTYLTAEKRYTRMATGDGPRYQVTERTPEAMQLVPASYAGARYVDQFVGVANVTPTGVREVDGTTLIVLEADGSNATSVESANLTDYNATMLVDEDGVVHSVTVEATATSEGTTSTTRFSMELSNLGDTTVEEPSWLDEARNQSSESSA